MPPVPQYPKYLEQAIDKCKEGLDGIAATEIRALETDDAGVTHLYNKEWQEICIVPKPTRKNPLPDPVPKNF